MAGAGLLEVDQGSLLWPEYNLPRRSKPWEVQFVNIFVCVFVNVRVIVCNTLFLYFSFPASILRHANSVLFQNYFV